MAANAWLRYDVIRQELDRVAPAGGRLGRVLEVGAGQGGVGARLALRSSYTGVDLDATSLAVARERIDRLGVDARVLTGLADDVLDAGETFDWVCAFEVLEHIRDDRAALDSWVARLRPGGRLLISVPAFAARYGPFDRLAGHFRRYEPERLRDLLGVAGLRDVRTRVYGMPLGFVLEAGRDALARRRGFPASPDGLGGDGLESARSADDELHTSTLASARLFQPGRALGPVLAGATLPFRVAQRRWPDRGTGLVAVGRREP